MNSLTFGSLFSGIGGLDDGFVKSGMKCAWQVEIDEHCNKVLRKHYPDTKRYKDVKTIGGEKLEKVSIIIGGFPCQDVSLAGKRKGLAGERSGLWFQFHRIVQEILPPWVVIENVPGLLLSSEGRDFATILYELGQCGYTCAYRILDAQYWGVAQQRRRVFVVGSLGNTSCAEILFESEGLPWYPKKGKKSKQRTARETEKSPGNYFKGLGMSHFSEGKIATCLRSNHTDDLDLVSTFGQDISGTLCSRDHKGVNIHFSPSENKVVLDEYNGAISFNWQSGGDCLQSPKEERTDSLHSSQTPAVFNHSGLRRLTPIEFERLQGFEDNYTKFGIDDKGNEVEISDSQRYKMLGNAVCTKVSRWIAGRINKTVGVVR